jgi:DNA-binding transcriptional ArsR family regulator
MVTLDIVGMDVFEVLADPIRRRIVEMLSKQEHPAGEIASAFEVTGPAISRHLRILREVGIVEYRRDGQRWVYRLDPTPLRAVEAWMRHNVAAWEHRFQALGRQLDSMAASASDARPRRKKTAK